MNEPPKKIKVLCAYCGKVIKDGPLTPDGYASHWICKHCRDREIAKIEEIENRSEANK
jgi:hypothetical protein